MEFWLGDCDLIPNSHVLLWTVGEAGIRCVSSPFYCTNMNHIEALFGRCAEVRFLDESRYECQRIFVTPGRYCWSTLHDFDPTAHAP